MEPSVRPPRKTRSEKWARHLARADNGRVAKVLRNDGIRDVKTDGGYGHNLTLFAVPVVVAMSDFVVK
jgi:hypothetical protein